MTLVTTDHIFHDASTGLHIHKSFPDNRELQCHIHFGADKFVDYQRDIFQDFLGILVDALADPEVYIEDFLKIFEKELQHINTKLSIFAEKMTSVEQFPIKGMVQVFFEREYVAALIGPVGLMVLRDNDLNYMMSNQEEKNLPISLFSEIIEGEVKEYDEVVVIGIPIDTYIDKTDFTSIRDIHLQQEKTFIEGLLDLLEVRVARDDITFVLVSQRESKNIFSQKKIKKNVSTGLQHVQKFSERWTPYYGYLIYAGIGLFALLMIFRLYQSFNNSNQARFVDTNGDILVDFTIDDIQKDIAQFKRIDPTLDQKVKKYQEIIGKLNLLEENNRWTNDVRELKKILETEYYEGFNIIFAENDNFFQAPVYEFTQQEKNTLAEARDIFYNSNGLMVSGKEGVMLGAVNNDVRGTLISAAPGMEFTSCSINLLKNGLYCASSEDAMYNITKAGLNPMTNVSGVFPTNIVGVSTFASSNIYVLTHDESLNGAGTYVVKYKNRVGSQDEFGEGTEYILNAPTTGGLAFVGSGFTSFAIDGTFLTWSPVERSIYQLRRPSGGPELQYREVELIGGDTIEPYSENTKIIASADSRFVYLFDKEHQTFTVYRSTPYKTNDANTYTYSLTYFFRIKFAAAGRDITDLFVEEGEKSNLYLLTDGGIYGIKLHEHIDTFFQKEAR